MIRSTGSRVLFPLLNSMDGPAGPQHSAVRRPIGRSVANAPQLFFYGSRVASREVLSDSRASCVSGTTHRVLHDRKYRKPSNFHTPELDGMVQQGLSTQLYVAL